MTRSAPSRLVVLASGSGTNLQAIIDACATNQLEAQIVGVASDVADAYALRRASDHKINSQVVAPQKSESRKDFDARLAAVVAGWQPDLVILAGFMRVLSVMFISQFPGRVINLHPALPGQLAGTNSIARAFAEFKSGSRLNTGVMVHFVPDEGVDNGPVILSETVAIEETDTFATLEARMHSAEHRVLIQAIKTLIATQQKETVS